LLTIITAHAKKNPPELDLVLKKVMRIRLLDSEV